MLQRQFAQTRFGPMTYAEAGRGPALIHLPGTGQTHAMFARQIEALSRRFRAVGLDPPGSPGSAPLPDPLSVERLAESVVAAMDALGIEQAHVYGIHLGNKIGAALAAGWPHRVGEFIFSGQSHSIMADNARRNAHVRALTRHYFSDGPDDPARRDARRLYEANFAYDLERDLRRIPNRTLVVEIATRHETAECGLQGPALLAHIPRSALVTFHEPDGVGHTLDNRAEELAEAIFAFIR
ncbi:MAG: alpha/beta fold hydrolase [Alphaproteobacteria bacterium]